MFYETIVLGSREDSEAETKRNSGSLPSYAEPDFPDDSTGITVELKKNPASRSIRKFLFHERMLFLSPSHLRAI